SQAGAQFTCARLFTFGIRLNSLDLNTNGRLSIGRPYHHVHTAVAIKHSGIRMTLRRATKQRPLHRISFNSCRVRSQQGVARRFPGPGSVRSASLRSPSPQVLPHGIFERVLAAERSAKSSARLQMLEDLLQKITVFHLEPLITAATQGTRGARPVSAPMKLD